MTIEAEAAVPTANEAAVAIVRGQPVVELPQDLYIPPNALEVFLEAFEGPLDLLLYLIKRQNFDILDIPIAEVTRQYISYIDLMKELKLELAAEYLVMAAMLAEIKSRLLLPRPAELEAEEADPRAELIRRLQEYERIKKAAEELDRLPQQGRDIFPVAAQVPELPVEPVYPALDLRELAVVFQDILKRASLVAHHHIQREPLSIRERMSQILVNISERRSASFVSLFSVNEGKLGVVVTFIALLELLKQAMIELFQEQPFGEILVKAVGEAN
jgi:segregation and condensation protein A